jgi:chromate transporter
MFCCLLQLPCAGLQETDASVRSHGLNMFWGGLTIAVWLVVLIVTIVLASTLPGAPLPLKWWEVFYRTGSIIYGGGQVVLPMLYTDVVQQTCDANGQNCSEANSWVTSEQFYAGLGVAQAMPGPLFNFSAYLGAIIAMRAGYNFMVGAVLAWFGLFGPGVLLIFGIMPFWGKFRTWSLYRRVSGLEQGLLTYAKTPTIKGLLCACSE